MNLPISVFEIKAEIAKENKIRSIKWATVSGIEPSRISEYRRRAKQTKAGAAESDEERAVGGHLFSFRNFFTLLDGLKTLVGDKALQAGLIRQLELRKSRLPTKVRLFMKLMVLSDAQLRLVDTFADAILHRAITSQNPKNR